MPISVTDIEKLVLPILDENNLVLCYVKVLGSIRNPLIQLFIDKKEGFVTVKECVVVTRSAQDLLGLQDNVPADYRLEVSSPGVDYPLREIWQFKKNIGHLIQKSGSDLNADESETLIFGRIVDVDTGGNITLDTEEGIRELGISELAEAHIVLETPKKNKLKRKRHET